LVLATRDMVRFGLPKGLPLQCEEEIGDKVEVKMRDKCIWREEKG
jgi:hypothetical protein